MDTEGRRLWLRAARPAATHFLVFRATCHARFWFYTNAHLDESEEVYRYPQLMRCQLLNSCRLLSQQRILTWPRNRRSSRPWS